MAANMYRVGDFVYFETSPTAPYQIRRIEELNKTSNGNVEAKVMCFYRRRDISSSLVNLADKHHDLEGSDSEGEPTSGQLTSEQKRLLRHRELFLSRQVESLPATHIRGKCSVTVLSDSDQLSSYLNSDDTYFYSLTYDSSQKTLLADKGEIRVGDRYQAKPLPEVLANPAEEDDRKCEDVESLVWKPEQISDEQIDKFLVLTRSVGTFARALDPSSSVRQPSLHMSAAAASRDITMLNALNALHASSYDVSEALSSLIPSRGPVIYRDEMEEWSASEANLFEEALDKYGKDFSYIKQDFLPWKTLRSIVEYYYMWKTTDRFVQQKRIKAAEADSKLKQVYIPAFNKVNPVTLTGRAAANGPDTRACEGCATQQSSLWLAWGAVHLGQRVCRQCWDYWKKMGALKNSKTDEFGNANENIERPHPGLRQERIALQQQAIRLHRCNVPQCGKEFRTKAHLSRHMAQVHGMMVPSAPSPIPGLNSSKSRTTFFLLTTGLTRVCRRLCKDLLPPRHAALHPCTVINVQQLKIACQSRLSAGLKATVTSRRSRVCDDTVSRLGVDISLRPELLKKTERQEAQVFAFPKPKEPFPLPSEIRALSNKRALSNGDSNGSEPEAKRANTDFNNHSAEKPAVVNGGTNGSSARNGVDSSDDLMYLINKKYRNYRQQLGVSAVRKAARNPSILLPKSLALKQTNINNKLENGLKSAAVNGTAS